MKSSEKTVNIVMENIALEWKKNRIIVLDPPKKIFSRLSSKQILPYTGIYHLRAKNVLLKKLNI
jgi:hypothetical protein